MTSAYPLQWPEALPRSKGRETGAFKTTLSKALENVETSLRLFGRDSGAAVKDVVLSSNVTLGANRPADPGVAAWFSWEGEQRCIAVDRYTSVEANLQAIHHVMEARRTELRHGTLAMVRASFQGLKMLPPPPGSRPWREVLDLTGNPTRAQIEEAFREKSKAVHPDRPGGTLEKWGELTRAKDQALQEAAS